MRAVSCFRDITFFYFLYCTKYNNSAYKQYLFFFLILKVVIYISEVEKQLQGNEGALPLTPHMSYKKSHSGSTGNIHGLVGLTESTGGNFRNDTLEHKRCFTFVL